MQGLSPEDGKVGAADPHVPPQGRDWRQDTGFVWIATLVLSCVTLFSSSGVTGCFSPVLAKKKNKQNKTLHLITFF